MAVYTIDPFDAQMPAPIDLRTVKLDAAQRDAIPTNARYPGLEVWVVSEAAKYRWESGAWVLVTSNLQNVTVSGDVPTSGNTGDIHFRTVASGTEIYYNTNLGWALRGTIGGAELSAILNDNLDPFGETSASLDSTYPNAKIGDIVYTEIGQTKWQKLANGKWNRSALDIV